MWNPRQLETLYKFACALSLNPKISIRKLHELYSHYSNREATTKLLKEAIEREVIVGPFIYCNSGLSVNVYTRNEINDPLGFLQSCRKNPLIVRAIALFGEYSFISFKKGKSELAFAETIKPSLNTMFVPEDIRLQRKGKLPSDPYPQNWDELDWKIYDLMRNPRISYGKVSGEIRLNSKSDVSWKTVEVRFKKIIKDCKIMVGFFPNGTRNYSQTFLTLKTDFEEDLRKELQRLDRSTYLYKARDTILLNLFLDNNIQHRIFVDFEKRGLIRDLHVSIPVYWWTPLLL